jgi:hypothetical protein
MGTSLRLVQRYSKTKALCASDSGEQSRGERTNQCKFGNVMSSVVNLVQKFGTLDRAVTTKAIHPPRIRSHRKGLSPTCNDKARILMWMRMDTEMDLAIPIEGHRPDDVHLRRLSSLCSHKYFQKTVSIWVFLADHVGKGLFHWLLTHRQCDDPPLIEIEKTNSEMKNQRGSQLHQSDQIWPHYGSSSAMCALTLNPET